MKVPVVKKETGGQAFPSIHVKYTCGSLITKHIPGMTLREYAAIELRIPDSGVDWLDEMIAKAERRDIATKAMQGLIIKFSGAAGYTSVHIAKDAYTIADSVLKERDK